MIESRNLSRLPELLYPQAMFRSPMAFKPYESAAAVNLILNTVVTVFEDFAYHREFVSAAGSTSFWSSAHASASVIDSSRAST